MSALTPKQVLFNMVTDMSAILLSYGRDNPVLMRVMGTAFASFERIQLKWLTSLSDPDNDVPSLLRVGGQNAMRGYVRGQGVPMSRSSRQQELATAAAQCLRHQSELILCSLSTLNEECFSHGAPTPDTSLCPLGSIYEDIVHLLAQGEMGVVISHIRVVFILLCGHLMLPEDLYEKLVATSFRWKQKRSPTLFSLYLSLTSPVLSLSISVSLSLSLALSLSLFLSLTLYSINIALSIFTLSLQALR